MQRIYFILLFVFLYFHLEAQEVGIRFGEMAGNNIAIDGVFAWKDSRIHADISFGDGIGMDAVYDFVVQPINAVDNLYYYLGVGLTILFGDEFKFGAVGEVGIEYRFQNSPISLSLDYKPAIIIIETTDFLWGNFGINARYVFNK